MPDAPPGKHIGLIGAGLMGTAIAERLLAHGYQVSVWNRSRDKTVPLIARGALWCDHPSATCERVVISLYSSEAVEQVLGDMWDGLHAGQIVVDTTTGEPEQSAALGARLAERGVRYLDAPISGSSEQTRRGEASVIVGGERAAFEACADLWPCLGRIRITSGRAGMR